MDSSIFNVVNINVSFTTINEKIHKKVGHPWSLMSTFNCPYFNSNFKIYQIFKLWQNIVWSIKHFQIMQFAWIGPPAPVWKLSLAGTPPCIASLAIHPWFSQQEKISDKDWENMNKFLLHPVVSYSSKWFGRSAMAGCHY